MRRKIKKKIRLNELEQVIAIQTKLVLKDQRPRICSGKLVQDNG